MTSTIDQIDYDAQDASADGQISYSELLTIRALCEIGRQIERMGNHGGVWEMSQADKEKKQALEQFWTEKAKRDHELHSCTQLDYLALCPGCPDAETCIHPAQGPDWDSSPPAWDCEHIPTDGNDEPMTQTQDSRDSAGLPRP